MKPKMDEMKGRGNYIPQSLHEAMTWILGLPLDASAEDIAGELMYAALKHEGDKAHDANHPDSHMILVAAIKSPSESESDALKTLAKVALKVSREGKHGG